jgi:ABC-type sulfate/molybdate transport systems ATPase subunit
LVEISAQPAASFASVGLRHRIGALQLDVTFTLTQPWTILFGPSGSGKTTVLRAMAGLIRPNHARIVFGPPGRQTIAVDTHPPVFEDAEKPVAADTQAPVFDDAAGSVALKGRGFSRAVTASSSGPALAAEGIVTRRTIPSAAIFVPAHLRCTRVAAQQTALFPHMTVRENIAFGARPANDGPAPNTLVDQAIEQFHLGSLAAMLPAKLSGGERQRVAIARAAASAISLRSGAILLLDEPFAGMDAKLRDELIADLQRSLAALRIPVLSVTHDVAEAFQLDAEVIKLAEGRVVEQGPVASVLADERARLLAQLSPSE